MTSGSSLTVRWKSIALITNILLLRHIVKGKAINEAPISMVEVRLVDDDERFDGAPRHLSSPRFYFSKSALFLRGIK